jgi:hypothetical protein
LKNGTPHERAEAVRAHAKLDLRFADLFAAARNASIKATVPGGR